MLKLKSIFNALLGINYYSFVTVLLQRNLVLNKYFVDLLLKKNKSTFIYINIERREKMTKDFSTIKIGESLVAGGPPGTAAEPEVAIGEMNGPFGTAFANLLANQIKGHTKVLAIMNTDIMVRPATLMVSKVTVNDDRYTNILMGTVQAAIANGVLDSVREGSLPKEKANDLGVIVSVWLNPSVSKDDNLDHKILFDIHRRATANAIKKAVNNEPSIDWLLENQEKIVHKYYQMGLDKKI